MKVAVVVNYFSPFIRSNEYYLCKKLGEKGHDVTLYTSDVGHKRARWTLRGVETKEVEDFKLKRLKTIADFVENPLYPSIYREIKQGGYDLVHAHEDWQIGTFLSFLAARSKRIPFILSEERYYPPGRLRAFFNFFDSECASTVRNQANAVTAHSTAAKDYLMERGLAQEKIKVIPVGVDTKLFKPLRNSDLRVRLGIKSSDIVILNVGRLHPYKGQRLLIEAFKRVRQMLENVKLLIVGRGFLKENFTRLIEGLKLQNDVFLIDEAYPNDVMPSIYANCDIFCLPSLVEPFGIAVLEAMACGKPVIGTKVSGMLETIAYGKVGFLVNPNDVDGLSARLMDLALDEALRNRLGGNALKRAKTVFDWDIIIKEYLAIYERLTGS